MIQKGVKVFPYVLLVLLIFALLLILHLKYYSGLFLLIFAILGVLIYIILSPRTQSDFTLEHMSQEITPFSVISLPESSFRYLISIFLILFSLSLLTIVNEFYSKSILYYIFIAICSGILILEIYTYRNERQGYLILLQAILLSLNVIFTNFLTFQHGIALPDMGLHLYTFVTTILTTGHISTSTVGFYNAFPIHHVLAAMGI